MKIKLRKKQTIKYSQSPKTYLKIDDQDENADQSKRIGDLLSFKILLKFARPYRLQIFTSLFVMLLSSLCAVFSSKLMGNFIEEGLIKKDLNLSIGLAFAIIVLEILSIYTIWTSRKSLGEAASLVIFSIRTDLFKKLQNLPIQYFDQQPQGRIVTRLTSDVEGIEEFFTSSLGNLLSALMTTVLCVGAMVFTNLKLGIILLLTITPSFFIMYLTKDLLKDSNRRVSKFSSAINAKLSEYLSGLDVIRSFGLEQWSMNKFDDSVDDYLNAQLKGNFLFAWSIPVVIFCVSIPLIGLIWFGGVSVLHGTMGLGVFISFVRYYERFFNPMMLITREIHVVQQAFTSTERVMGFLNEDDEDSTLTSTGNIQLEKVYGDIKFNNVFMAYHGDNYILKNINFHITPGEKIGLVGKTGCGKSSTVSLLSRLYEFQSGDILIDDISIRSINRNKLRSQIGFVSQDAIIFKGTLRENLTTDLSVSDQTLIDACRETGLSKAFMKSGLNLDMAILEGGTNLSVGERQLISLTRVLLKNPSLLILDEATANIDPHFEQIISESISRVMKGRTCLIIAHRLDTLKDCDRIFVFNSGELVEEGTLDKLMHSKNYFFNLHNAQSIH